MGLTRFTTQPQLLLPCHRPLRLSVSSLNLSQLISESHSTVSDGSICCIVLDEAALIARIRALAVAAAARLRHGVLQPVIGTTAIQGTLANQLAALVAANKAQSRKGPTSSHPDNF